MAGHGLQENDPPDPNDVVNPIQYIDYIENIARREKYGCPGEFEYGVNCPDHGFRLLSFPLHGRGGAMVWCHIHPGNGWKNVQPLGPPPQGWDPARPPPRVVRCCIDCHPLTTPQSPYHGPFSPVGGHYQTLSGQTMQAHYSHQQNTYPAPNGSPPNTGFHSLPAPPPPPPPHQQPYQDQHEYQAPATAYPIYQHQPQAHPPYASNPNLPHAATWQHDPNSGSGSRSS